jgi:hypothetical protein
MWITAVALHNIPHVPTHFSAVGAEQLYILTHPEYNLGLQKRMEHIIQQRNPA